MPISRDSLLSLEAYAKARPALRAEIIEHKNAALCIWATM